MNIKKHKPEAGREGGRAEKDSQAGLQGVAGSFQGAVFLVMTVLTITAAVY